MVKLYRMMIVALLLATTACAGPTLMLGKGTTKWLLPKPVPVSIGAPDPNAPDAYKIGWKHGCESGLAAYGNSYYKKFYKFRHDVKRINDPVYFRSWIDAFSHCRSFVNRYLGSGFWGSDWPDGSDTKMFGNGELRDARVVVQDGTPKGLPDFMDEISIPGWGSQAWGASVDQSHDFLGYPVTPTGSAWAGNSLF